MNPRVIYDTMKTAKFAKGNLDVRTFEHWLLHFSD